MSKDVSDTTRFYDSARPIATGGRATRREMPRRVQVGTVSRSAVSRSALPRALEHCYAGMRNFRGPESVPSAVRQPCTAPAPIVAPFTPYRIARAVEPHPMDAEQLLETVIR